MLAALTLREIRLSLRESFRTSSGSCHHRRILLVELSDEAGSRGWAECVADTEPWYSSETIDTAWLAIREWIAPVVLGLEVHEGSDVHRSLRHIRGHRMAKAAVEMATWDLIAKRRGVALARLLGGTRERVATGISIGIQESPEALVRQAAAAMEAGYRRLKIKIAPGQDVELVRAVRTSLGPAAPLMVDANASYAPQDVEVLRELDDFGLMMIEQPLAADDLVRHAALQQKLVTPICLDESITGLDRAQDMHTLGSGRIINIKPGRVGGFTESIAIHDWAAAAGNPVWCGGMLESGIGRAHNLALASLPHFTIPGDLSPSARYWEQDIVRPEWTMVDGRIELPLERPGIGVEVVSERVDGLTVRLERLTS